MGWSKATKDTAKRRIQMWEDQPEHKGFQSWAAGALLAGGSISAIDADDDGVGRSNVSQVVTTFKKAGWEITEEPAGPNGLKSYRLTDPPDGHAPNDKAKATRTKQVRREQPGTTHPQLGAVLTVRALALDDRGQLTVQLSNGTGAAWLATITGHVG